MIIDTHAHLMFKDFGTDKEIKEVIERAFGNGVEKIINVGCSLESSEQAVLMAEKYDNLYATVGLHPYDSLDANEKLMKKWEQMILSNKKIVAVGECGLDYFKARISKEIQKNAFLLQLRLAQKTGLPVIIHNRNADDDCLEILKEFDGSNGNPRVKAVFHCFGSDIRFARKIWQDGYFTSFTGIITYLKTENLREVVEEVPSDMFMVETDCPYLAPQKYRGKRNEPSYVVEVAKKIAEIKEISAEEVERISTQNVEKFFIHMT